MLNHAVGSPREVLEKTGAQPLGGQASHRHAILPGAELPAVKDVWIIACESRIMRTGTGFAGSHSLAGDRVSIGTKDLIMAQGEIMIFRQAGIRRGLGWTLFLWLIMPAHLRADLSVEQVTLLSGGMFEGLKSQASAESGRRMDEITSTVYVRKNQVREDSYFGKELVQSTIYSLPRGEIVTLNHQYKTYSIETFAHFKKQAPPPPVTADAEPPAAGAPKEVRKPLNLTTSIKDLGEEKQINGFNTRHYLMVTKLPGPQGDTPKVGEFELVSDLWLCKENLGYVELEQFRGALLHELGDTEDARAILPPKEIRTNSKVILALAEIQRFAKERDAAPISVVSEFHIKFHPAGAGSENNPDRKADPPTATQGGSSSAPTDRSGTDPVQRTRLFMRIDKEVHKIAAKPLEDSLFEIPKDYRRTGK